MTTTIQMKRIQQLALSTAFLLGGIIFSPVQAQSSEMDVPTAPSDTPKGLACAMPLKWVSGYINQPYPQTPLKVDETGVYTGSDHVYRLDLETGEVLWKHVMQGVDLYPVNDGISALTLDDDTVYFGGYSARVVALNKLTGEERWHLDFESYLHRNLAVDSKQLYIRPRGKLLAVDKRTGEIKIDFKTGGGAPVVDGDRVYIVTGNKAVTFDKHTGEIAWKTIADEHAGDKAGRGGDISRIGLSVSDSIPYLYQGQMMIFSIIDDFAYSFDMQTGEQLWRFDDFKGPRAHVLAGQGDTVLFYSTNGKIALFDIKKQEVLWQYYITANRLPPYVYKGLIFMGGDNKAMYVLDYATGKEVFRFEFPKGLKGVRAVVVQDDVVYFTTLDGAVQAHELKCPQLAGREEWK